MQLDHSHTKVILIGNGKYPMWPAGDIDNISVNLERLREILFNPELIGIPADSDRFNEFADAGKIDIEVQLSDIIDKCQSGDNLIVYYAGHGLIDISDINKLYLATSNTRIDRKKETCISSADLKDKLVKCKASNKIMILDCCYAAKAAGLQSDAESINASCWGNTEGVYFMMSSDIDQPSRFDPNNKTIPTFFTQKLIQTIAEGDDDTPGEEILTLGNFFKIMVRKWDSKVAPEPKSLTFKDIGDMPFCYNYPVKKKRTGSSIQISEEEELKSIEQDPTEDSLIAFINKCSNNDLVKKAMDCWNKLRKDWADLQAAQSIGTFEAMSNFIITNKPAPSIRKQATKHMGAMNKTENPTRSLNTLNTGNRNDLSDRFESGNNFDTAKK